MKSVVELLVEKESGKIIEEYLERNEILITPPKINGFHSTVYFSTRVPMFLDSELSDKLTEKLPIALNPETYLFDIFEGCLVLRYENETVRSINKMLLSDIERQIRDVWPSLNEYRNKILENFSKEEPTIIYSEFNPHITISKEFGKHNLGALPKLAKEIVLYTPNFYFE